MIWSSDGFTNILKLLINEFESCYLQSKYLRINKQTQFQEKKKSGFVLAFDVLINKNKRIQRTLIHHQV